MWLFDRLNVRLKLALLAGVPVLGAVLLSALIALDAQQRAATAKAIGSVEDLVQLTERVAHVVHELQAERSESAFRAGTGDTTSRELAAQEAHTDEVLGSLESFLNERDAAKLPAALGENLNAARRELRELGDWRKRVRSEEFRLFEYLEFHSRTTHSLIAATSVLSQLTADGELMLSISRLVAAMQVIERTSREHALLSYVFGKDEFPPGTFRFFVSLLTEQDVFAASLRASASADEYRRFQAVFEGPRAEKVKAMRKAALEATEGTLVVDPREWFELQNGNMQALRRLEDGMSRSVRAAVAKKMHESRRAIRLGMGLAAGVLLISTLLAWAIARSMTRSVSVLYQAAEQVQRDRDFSVRAQKTSKDELGGLTDAFNAMLAGIQERDAELQNHRENLEALVEARTLELSRRNDQMRLVLDNVEEGLAMVDRDGNLLQECSRSFADVFGEPQAGMPFHPVLSPDDPRTAAILKLGYDQYMEDFLPADLALDQMPKRLHSGAREYELALKPVFAAGRPDGALLVVRDVTAEVAAQRAGAIQREQIASCQHVLQDRHGFSDFFGEARALVECIRARDATDEVSWKRAIHTLKGNTALFEIRSVSEAAHELETAVREEPERTEAALAKLLGAWDEYEARVGPLLGDGLGQQLEVPKADFERALTAVRERLPHSLLEKLLQSWQREPAQRRFGRVVEQLRGLALRLGKPEPVVVINGNDVRLPSGRYREFWSSFAHVVRNMVDHGILAAEERERRGKPARTRIELNAFSNADELVLEIKDDGPGIDWSRLAARAQAAGLPARTRADLVRALTTDGVSTADHVTETSGRGVGMSAVLAACNRLNGKLIVESEPGEGTTFRFVFPATEHDTVRQRASVAV